LAKGYEPWQGWFTLQKRSKRSHISGEIYLCFQNVPPEAAFQDKMAVDILTVTVPHHQLYKYMLKGSCPPSFLVLSSACAHSVSCSNVEV